jgi:hypothetical protein
MIPNGLYPYLVPSHPLLADAIGRLSFSIDYHPYYEAESRKRNYFLDASIEYGLDPFNHFGIKASYQRGRNEDVGAPTNVYLLGVSGKI